MTAVVVNDDQIQASLLEALLDREGLEVRSFGSAASALQSLDPQVPPSIIVTDLYMPGIDGWRLCRLLRSPDYAPFNRVPVLVVSATFAGEEPARVTAEVGGNAFLAMPMDSRELGEHVRRLLRGEEPQRFLAVLIVEDNADEAAVLKTAFGAHGYRVDTALTGEQAETKFGAQAYDIVILDHHLPDTRGDRLLAAFKQQRPEAVYLAITGDPNPELALGWMKQGVAAFVSKPFAPQYLIELCVRAIREQDLLRVEDRLEIRTQELRRNEERHRSILRAALDGFWRADLEGRLLEVNEAYCRMSGYSEQELLAMNIADVEAAEGHADVAAHTHKIVTQGWDRFESRHRRKDGSCYPVEVSAQYKPADDGYTVAFIRDITAQKQAEAALRASEERYRGIFDESVTAIYVFDKDKHFLDSNQAGLDLLGYSREEFLRLSMPDVDADPQVVLRAHAELLSGGRLINYEHKLRRKDGSIVTVLNNSRSLTDPRGGVIGMQSTLVDITEHKRAEAALDHERYLLRTLVDLVPDFIFIKDTQSRFLMVNAALAKCYRQAPSAMLGRTDAELLPAEIAARCRASEGRVLLTDTCQAFEDTISFADGVPRTVVTHMVAFRDVHGQVGGLVGIGRDITDRKRSEEEREKLRAQLAHAQKMESVGRLAGGVAHDFNNMLQAILGNVSLALGCVPPESPLRESLEEIQSCAQRSAELTRQLLAFARKQTVTPKVLDLNETIEGMLKLLRRLIGEHISLAWLPGKNLGLVRLDPSQVDQVLANLCVNARDALEDGGRVTIETDNIAFDESYTAHHPEALAGDYVRIVVSDNGCGMEPEVLAHVFEPFFTTKEVGHGTGLGLATVYGIITQNGGFIVADSKPGQGTCFEIHLPRYAGKAAQLDQGAPAQVIGRGQETILLVEDEPAILRVGKRSLESLGYTVLAAATPGEAIRLAETHAGKIHLVITDVVMPEMNGRELATRLLSVYPNLKRLFMSGYTADIVAHHGVLEEDIPFIQKPFSIPALAEKVREALAQPGERLEH